ncbi:hypothetical protein [Ulvibacterium sp.]|uniref:hypothetical protein n=1 Tax=Ulvibacterium sp. TaxID=2665914 RepID=UPI002638F55E|nr:hypothetical protein [Ulvibacterium sp.]
MELKSLQVPNKRSSPEAENAQTIVLDNLLAPFVMVMAIVDVQESAMASDFVKHTRN